MMSKRLLLLSVSMLLLWTAATSFAAGRQEPTTDSVRELSVLGVWTGDTQARFEAVLTDFTEQTGIRVIYEPAGQNIGTVLGTQIEGGSPPDVAMLPQPGLLVEFAERGELVQLEEIVGDLVTANYAPVWRDLATVNGELYGVWYKAANKSFFWYNADVFAEAGVEAAVTWDDLMRNAEVISDYGIPPFSIGGASAWTLTDWFENIYLHSAGPELYDQLTNHEIPWTHPSVREAMSLFVNILERREWLAGGVAGTLEATHPDGIVKPFMSPPQAAMAYGADFSVGAILDQTDAVVGETARFFDFPTIRGSAPSVVGGGDVAVAFTDNDETRQFIRYLASPEAAEVWAPLGGYTSPNQQVDPSVYPNEVSRGSARALQTADVFRFDMSDLQPSAFGSTAGQGLFGLLQELVRNPQNMDAILERLESEATEAHGRR